MSDEWPVCDLGGCSGARIADATMCLAHVATRERADALQQFSKTGRLDVRGVKISGSLLKEILDAAPSGDDGNRKFLAARFDDAVFEEAAQFGAATFEGDAAFGGVNFESDAEFAGVVFLGAASFDNALFHGNARFGSATFRGITAFDRSTFKRTAAFNSVTFKDNAVFDFATFEGAAWFSGANFEDVATFAYSAFEGDAGLDATFTKRTNFGGATFAVNAGFGGANFKDRVDFDKAKFGGDAYFAGAAFEADARFWMATFTGSAVFGGTTFGSDVMFGRATFKGDVGFGRAKVKGDARFSGASFEGNATALGPLAVEGRLDMDDAQFASPVRIEAKANALSCRRVRFPGGVRFDLDRALVRLDDTDLSVPSLLTGPAVRPGSSTGNSERPKLLSLMAANVAGLTLANVDLTDCRFADAHNLDQLHLEANTVFGLSPAIAGWERRQVVAEESAWRRSRSRHRRWKAPPWSEADGEPEVLSPGVTAGLYRALRKGREDAKDEPGAADLYYGEMEMRRHDRSGGSRGRATRTLLFVYWLLSGYGLRAWRSLIALTIVTALFAVAFHFVGFVRPPSRPRTGQVCCMRSGPRSR